MLISPDRYRRILCTLFALLLSANLLAVESDEIKPQRYPLFEMGAGLLGVSFPDYPGASHSRRIYLPFPSLSYRGEILRSKADEGVRGRFINSRYVELDFSADGSLASDVTDNRVRDGMPDLDTVLELGPSLIFHLKQPTLSNLLQVDLHLPLRYVFSTDLSNTRQLGATINPFLTLQVENFFHTEDLFQFNIGIKYASEGLQDYYYEVAPQYQTATRPAFDAQPGLMEQSMSLLIYQPITVKRGLWIFGGVIRGNYRRAVNRDSTLLAEDINTSLALGIYYNFYRSSIYVYE
ncbi:MAG: hypothetical protein GQ470_05465 [Gammaproteobacteria bacterium]|nr:hypothetical protein [Gammaproteobacteria bacterium]